MARLTLTFSQHPFVRRWQGILTRLWRRVSRVLRYPTALLVSAVFLWLTLRSVSLEEVWRTIRRANFLFLPALSGLLLLQYWLAAVRWQQLVRHIGRVSVRDAFPRVLVAMSATTFLPFLLDQLLLVQISARAFRIGRAELAGAEFIERLVEGFVYALVLTLTIVLFPVGPAFTGLAAFMLFGTLTGFGLVWWFTRPTSAGRPPGPSRRWFDEAFWQPAVHGMQSVRRPRQLRDIFLLTVGVVLTEAVFYGLVAVALGIRANPLLFPFLVSAGNIGAAIPFTQGGTGAIFVVQQAFQAAGQSANAAAAYALSVQGLIAAPIIILGPVAAYVMRLTPRELFAVRMHIEPHGPDERPASETPPGYEPPPGSSARPC